MRAASRLGGEQLTPPGRQRRRRRTEAGDRRRVLHAGPPGPLLLAADQQWLDAQPPADDERADPGGAAQLVGAHRHQVGVEAGQVQFDVPAGSGGVDVHRHPGPAAEVHHLGDGLDRADLVIGPLAVHECRGILGVASQGEGHPFGLDPAVAVDRQQLHVGQPLGGVAHGGVLHPAQSTTAPGRARVAPHTAALTASVPPEVKTTWRGRTPSSPATCSRASSRVARTIRPSWCTRPGSAAGPSSQARRAAVTSGRSGEVEAWSR